jgi:hypothetical protein
MAPLPVVWGTQLSAQNRLHNMWGPSQLEMLPVPNGNTCQKMDDGSNVIESAGGLMSWVVGTADSTAGVALLEDQANPQEDSTRPGWERALVVPVLGSEPVEIFLDPSTFYPDLEEAPEALEEPSGDLWKRGILPNTGLLLTCLSPNPFD